MKTLSANERVIFGLKVKQLRRRRGYSFGQLSERAGISLSYLNEIEKGKKFPSAAKLTSLAEALGTTREELLDGQLGRELAPVAQLLRSNFLNELPLDLFGIELSKVAEFIAAAPVRVGAFISTLLDISRNYELREENFYFAALRAYLELNDNYFPELEEAVDRCIAEFGLPQTRPLRNIALENILRDHYGYRIVEDGLRDHPALSSLRSVYLPDSDRLLLNGQLTGVQRSVQLSKELGFNYLGLTERARTSSILRARRFEEVLNHSKATYFSVALHMPLQPFVEQVHDFLARDRWDPDAYLDLMHRWNGTPEGLCHRLTNVLPRFFGMGALFFLRFVHRRGTNNFRIDRELHLSRRHHPHENGLHEHYCRRWVSTHVLQEMDRRPTEGLSVAVQRSHYYGTDDEYLCLTIARTGYPSPDTNVSVTIGLLLTDDTRRRIGFIGDPAIPRLTVNTTCERCPIDDCQVRAAPPHIVERRERGRAMRRALKALH